ncbi:MAG: hypothetical protein ACOC7K_00500 [bacterium]
MCDARRMETVSRLFSLFKAICQLYTVGTELRHELDRMEREFLSSDSPAFPSEDALREALEEDFDPLFVREYCGQVSTDVDSGLPADQWVGLLRRIREGITRLRAAADDVHRQIDSAPRQLLDDLRAPAVERWTFRLRTRVRQVAVGYTQDPDVGKAVVMFVMDESVRRMYWNYNWNNFYPFEEDLTSLVKGGIEQTPSQWAQTSETRTDALEAVRNDLNEVKLEKTVLGRLRAMADEGREFPGLQELSSELECPADTVQAALDQDPALRRWSLLFFPLLEWAENNMKGKQLRVVQLLVEQGGEMRIADIAVDSQIEWSGSVEQVKRKWKSIQREVNAKLNRRRIPYLLRRQGDRAYLEHDSFA